MAPRCRSSPSNNNKVVATNTNPEAAVGPNLLVTCAVDSREVRRRHAAAFFSAARPAVILSKVTRQQS